jgi:hypothetical protein
MIAKHDIFNHLVIGAQVLGINKDRVEKVKKSLLSTIGGSHDML